MSLLPTLESPTFSITLPVSKKEIKFRPYFVKEKKLLTMAVESKNDKTLIDSIKELLDVCVISGDISDICLVDCEYLFYNLRARSESEIVDLRYNCEVELDNRTCRNVIQLQLNLLSDLNVSTGNDPLIQLSDTIGIKLKHEKFIDATFETDTIYSPDEIFGMVAENTEYIYDENSTYKNSEIPRKELISWLEKLKPKEFSKIEDFFTNQPKITKEFNIKCNKCGTDHNIIVEDIFSFLD